MKYPELEKLIHVVNEIRHPKRGCPWDLEQTHQSLLKYLIEESYEFLHAVEDGSDQEMEEEIGDVLFQVLLHSKIADERSAFSLESVAKKLADKMIRRHPHVFDNDSKKDLTPEEVIDNWDKIKKQEKDRPKLRIDENYLKFPALFAANKIGRKTHKIEFDWSNPEEVLEKVEEELRELKEEIKSGQYAKVNEEFGDFIFSVAQLARHLKIDPEESLRMANKKFIRRFNQMELLLKKENLQLEDLDRSTKEDYWQKVKRQERK